MFSPPNLYPYLFLSLFSLPQLAPYCKVGISPSPVCLFPSSILILDSGLVVVFFDVGLLGQREREREKNRQRQRKKEKESERGLEGRQGRDRSLSLQTSDRRGCERRHGHLPCHCNTDAFKHLIALHAYVCVCVVMCVWFIAL